MNSRKWMMFEFESNPRLEIWIPQKIPGYLGQGLDSLGVVVSTHLKQMKYSPQKNMDLKITFSKR